MKQENNFANRIYEKRSFAIKKKTTYGLIFSRKSVKKKKLRSNVISDGKFSVKEPSDLIFDRGSIK